MTKSGGGTSPNTLQLDVSGRAGAGATENHVIDLLLERFLGDNLGNDDTSTCPSSPLSPSPPGGHTAPLDSDNPGEDGLPRSDSLNELLALFGVGNDPAGGGFNHFLDL
jgi:hypothetical protein